MALERCPVFVVYIDGSVRGGDENEPCREGYAVWGCGEYTVPYCCNGDDSPYNAGEPALDGEK